MPATVETTALVVGGGTVGLTSAALLAMHGIPSVLVERRLAPSILPRAAGVHIRSMEIFRSLGLEERVRSLAVDTRGLPLATFMHTLNEEPLSTIAPDFLDADAVAALTPSPYCYCTEDRISTALLERLQASELCTVRFGEELIDFEQAADGVTACVRDVRSGAEHTIRSRYLVAADGAHSHTRRLLGIDVEGYHEISHELIVLFRANLDRVLDGRRSVLFRIDNERLHGFVRSGGVDGRWILQVDGYEGAAAPAECIDLVRMAAGDPSLEVELLTAQPWVQVALVAGRFSQGAVFLVGDAAHALTPGGALGMNTGLQDAHNLAWKLATHARGVAGDGLVETYNDERRPVALRNADVGMSIAVKDFARIARMLDVLLGYSYESSAVIPDDQDRFSGPSRTEYTPTGRPGERAPHLWIEVDGRRISTLDLFGKEFVLLAGSEGAAWVRAAERVAPSAGTLSTFIVSEAAWPRAYGVGTGGAVLVRPDGHVAWRTPRMVTDCDAALSGVWQSLLAGGQRFQRCPMPSKGH
jgi:putative polyketide hydroxylase